MISYDLFTGIAGLISQPTCDEVGQSLSLFYGLLCLTAACTLIYFILHKNKWENKPYCTRCFVWISIIIFLILFFFNTTELLYFLINVAPVIYGSSSSWNETKCDKATYNSFASIVGFSSIVVFLHLIVLGVFLAKPFFKWVRTHPRYKYLRYLIYTCRRRIIQANSLETQNIEANTVLPSMQHRPSDSSLQSQTSKIGFQAGLLVETPSLESPHESEEDTKLILKAEDEDEILYIRQPPIEAPTIHTTYEQSMVDVDIAPRVSAYICTCNISQCGTCLKTLFRIHSKLILNMHLQFINSHQTCTPTCM